MTNKLFVFDVGNTLLVKPDNVISSDTVACLRSLREKGNFIGVASMRNRRQLRALCEVIPFDFCIGLNGTYAEVQSETIIDCPLNDSELCEIGHFVSNHDIKCLLHTKDEPIPFSRRKDESVYVVELLDVNSKLGILIDLLRGKFTFHIWEDGKSCDIYAKRASKRKALDVVRERLEVPRQNCIAFGDGFNDVELFEFCGKSIAMATAPDELKNVATYTTKSVRDEGVVWALNHFEL